MATREQIDELAAKLHEERAALLAALDGLTEERAEFRPAGQDGEAGWSIKEQLAHLATMEVGYRKWCERAVAEDNPDLDHETYPDPVAFAVAEAHQASAAQLIAELQSQRETTLRFMRTLTPEQYDHRSHNQIFGELTVLQWLRSYYRHDRMHAAQIEGRASTYQPRFLTGEPDQRRRG